MKTTVKIVASLAAVLLASTAWATEAVKTPKAEGMGMQEKPVGKEVRAVTPDKMNYLNDLAIFDETQIAYGRLALERSTNPKVKDFARRLISDHESHRASLKNYAAAQKAALSFIDLSRSLKGIGGTGQAEKTISEDLLAEASKHGDRVNKEVDRFLGEKDKLAAKIGVEFDRDFLARVDKRQEKGQKAVKDGLAKYPDDPALVSLLNDTRPVVKDHRDEIARLKRELKG